MKLERISMPRRRSAAFRPLQQASPPRRRGGVNRGNSHIAERGCVRSTSRRLQTFGSLLSADIAAADLENTAALCSLASGSRSYRIAAAGPEDTAALRTHNENRWGDPAQPERLAAQPAAFTLIELVISSALMSMILVSAYICLRAGLSSQRLIDSRVDAIQSARVAMDLIAADLRSACPLSKEFEFLGMHREVGPVVADNLDFATHNYTPRRAHESDWCEISYFLDRDRATGKFSLWRRRDPTPDPEPLSGGIRQEIARNVRGLRFEYYDGFDWYSEWGDVNGRGKKQNSFLTPPNLYGLPEAVRITLWFEPVSRTKPAANAEEEKGEPPLVFQTIARLELADRQERSAGGSSNSSSPNQDSGGAGQPQPQSGAPGGYR